MARAYDELDEQILDAALARILQVGIRRASLDDIARRTGINRVTIYRRFAGKDNVVDAVLSREIERILGEVTAIARAAPDVDAQIEETVLYILRQTRTHPLVVQLIEVSPEEALSFYTVRGEEMVSQGIAYISGILESAQQSGAIPHYDVGPVAELVARLAHSLLLTPRAGIDFDDEVAARVFVRTAVVPMMKYGFPAASAAPVAADSDAEAPRAR
ncbi:TetR/AcrR family transcriptional regulator [Nocardia takedensis]|uniref:TetR/AcrR family transcriptional regulator n=1 Tax=Nocardia takedensis TaxID=259390 RepID=UPI0002E71FFF|nr:TetR/AcrR family transcriptional regulator [Nocardia takedensis]